MEKEFEPGNDINILTHAVIVEKKNKLPIENNEKSNETSIMIDVLHMLLCRAI